jgi:hypothetical protein
MLSKEALPPFLHIEAAASKIALSGALPGNDFDIEAVPLFHIEAAAPKIALPGALPGNEFEKALTTKTTN